MADLNRWQMLKEWIGVLCGKRAGPAAAHYFTTDELTIETDPLQLIDVDGELIAQTPTHFRVAPEALKGMAPQTFVDE
jgi:diacylglycerol kinase family enzyme